MPAPSADFPGLGASTSSSGYTDGLGRRALAFDREDGTMLERLVVRAELSAFERSLRERLDRIAGLDDERLARPRSIERGNDNTLVVLSEFVPGSRLSDLLDSTAQQGMVPGVDVALGFLLDVLPALCGLHAGAGFAHGAISPGRTVLTPAGQVVLLDGIFGDALARLQYSRHRLWAEFGVALSPSAGPPRLDASCDIAQVALSALMLVLGRPVAEYEYPDVIPSLLAELSDVAQIRGSSEFAVGLQRFFERALPVPGARPYTAADDALIDARDLARELGLDVCRRALVEFIEQDSGASAGGSQHHTGAEYGYGYEADGDGTDGSSGEGDELDAYGDAGEVELELDAPAAAEEDTIYDLGSDSSGDGIEEGIETEPAAEIVPETFHADAFVPPVAVPELEPEPVAPVFDAIEAAPFLDEPIGQAPAAQEITAEATSVEPPAEIASPSFAEEARDAEFESKSWSSESEPASSVSAFSETLEEVPELRDAVSDPEELVSGSDDEISESAGAPFEKEESGSGTEEEPADDAGNSRRRKRSRSVRSRKDKLRSTARPQPLAPPPPAVTPPPIAPPVAASKPKGSGWLVEPGRAAAFDPPVPVQAAPPQPPAPVIAAPPPLAPPISLAPPQPPPQVPQPVAPLPMPKPIVVAPPVPAPVPMARIPVPPPAPAPLKLKTDAPSGYAPPRKARPDPIEDIYSPRAVGGAGPEASVFPWKLASAAMVLMVVGVVAGRAYLPGGAAAEKPVAVAEVARPAAAVPAPAGAAKTGRVQIKTEPSGARVLLNGKHVGESPLVLEVAAGRHTLTLATNSGSVRRTIRVETGKTATVDVPIYSGWVDVVAPIILDVAEDGKSIGNTEQNRLLLRPGRHELTFSNRDLDYTFTQTVDIEPGEVRTLTIDPKGTANLNASPWAEVWVNGKKVGDTPLANLQLPLGTHELVFKHPQFGERRVTTTIRANAPVAVSVDMSKP